MSAAEIEALYKEISSWPNQIGHALVTKDGIVIRSCLTEPYLSIYSAEIPRIVEKALKLVQSILLPRGKENKDDDVEFIRVKTKHHEILISPSSNYLLILLQNPMFGDIQSKIMNRDNTGGAEDQS